MKSNKLITAALMALGLVSSAHASTTFGTTNVVFITGSTAFRPNLFAAVTANPANGSATLFDPTNSAGAAYTVSAYVAGGGAANNGSSQYNAVGFIGGAPYIVSVSLTGSEAGLASLEGTTVTYTVPTQPELTPTPNAPVTLAGTPKPVFLDPSTQAATVTTQAPDLSLADTSQAVSLSASLSPLTDEGIVGVIPFVWAKGVNTVSDSSWKDLVNVTEPQLNNFLETANKANELTGSFADSDKVYLIGRNEGSGTRVNTLCDLFATIGNPISQYAINNSTYVGGNVLTVGAVTTLTSTSIAKNLTGVHLIPVGNDGFDAGSGVKTTLNSDIHGIGIVTLGYLGLSDAAGLTAAQQATNSVAAGGQILTLDGVLESDNAVINGEYPFWGHEHFYGAVSLTSSASLVAGRLAGSTINDVLEGFSANGAFEANGALSTGGGALGASTAVDPALMHADKPSGGDTGYPSPL